MKRSAAIGLLVAAAVATALALSPGQAASAPAEPALGPDGRVAPPPFGVGERLTFDVKYGFLSAGTAVLGIPEIVQERGRPCYRIVSLAESNAFVSAFFPVRDVVESLMDTRELVSMRFEKRLREGEFRSHDLVILDHDRHVAIYPRDTDDRLVPLSLYAQDILSSLYYVRMAELTVGKPVYIENHADKKNYPLEIRVLRKERVDVPAGKFDCIVVEPQMRTSGLFRHKGSLTVWLTDDDRHVPVLMKSRVVIGSISVTLAEMELAPVGPSTR